MINKPKKWISLHIYHTGDTNSLLKKVIVPLVKKLEEKKLQEKFFFIRYFEGGRHIRFRSLTDYSDELSHYLEAYLKRSSLKHWDDFGIVRFEFIDYVPEVERYGGPERIGVCEDFFCGTSVLILKHILKIRKFDTANAISFSFFLHLFFLHDIKARKDEVAEMFRVLVTIWIKSSEDFLKNFYQDDLTANALSLYQKSYESQKVTISSIVYSVEQSARESRNGWQAEYEQMVSKLRADINIEILMTNQHLVSSLLHMCNNRLGLLNSDESFLYYLLSRSTEKTTLFDE